jgi:hypothetical protein
VEILKYIQWLARQLSCRKLLCALAPWSPSLAVGDGRDPRGARVPPWRRAPPIARLCALLRAGGDPGGDDHDGNHLSAHRHQWRAEFALRRFLKGVGLTGTSIGILFAAIEVTSGLGSLFAGRAMRLGDPQRTMLSGTMLSILLICVTPFIGAIFALLFVAQALRSWL